MDNKQSTRMKVKSILLLLAAIVPAYRAGAQDIYVCRHATITFFSSAPIEDISAKTEKAVSAINMKSGAVYFKVPIRSFVFPKSLMQEHFNTDYLESDKYPFAEFKGNILNFSAPAADGSYPVTVQGSLTIHGVSKDYKEPGTLIVKNGKVTALTDFKIHIADHHITIPELLFKNIAEVVDVKVNATYSPEGKVAAGS